MKNEPLYDPINFVDNGLDGIPIRHCMSPEMLWDCFTKHVILEVKDALADSIRTGYSCRTRLNPLLGLPEDKLPNWNFGEPKPASKYSHIHSPKELGV
ncbi:hypothetical protein EH220_08150 [bacterium]|nr:MAG: hypothetical protein EH220_08150 [bacterium]